MKYLLILLLFITCQTSAQYSPAEIVAKKIHTVATKNGEYTTKIYYDQYGNDTAHYINGSIYQTKKHKYDNERLVSTSILNAEGKEYSTRTFVFLQDGTFFSMNTDKDFGMTDYTYYDKNGKKQRDVIPDGSERVYTYDKTGRLISFKSKPQKDAVKVDVTYQYDAKNRLIKETSKGDFKWTNTYTYNANGLIKNQTTSYIDEDGKKASSITTYTYELRK